MNPDLMNALSLDDKPNIKVLINIKAAKLLFKKNNYRNCCRRVSAILAAAVPG